MNDSKTKKIVLSALFAALACVATLSVRIPIPATSGYIHPGDAIVILSGIFLGPAYGALAAGIGSAMSDMIGGYFIYVPITFVVKAAVAFLSGKTFRFLQTKNLPSYMGVIAGGLIDAVVVVLGYGICETFLYGFAGASASIIPNLIQGIGGLVIASLLYPVLAAIPDFRRMAALPVHHRR